MYIPPLPPPPPHTHTYTHTPSNPAATPTTYRVPDPPPHARDILRYLLLCHKTNLLCISPKSLQRFLYNNLIYHLIVMMCRYHKLTMWVQAVKVRFRIQGQMLVVFFSCMLYFLIDFHENSVNHCGMGGVGVRNCKSWSPVGRGSSWVTNAGLGQVLLIGQVLHNICFNGALRKICGYSSLYAAM